jgi:tetratricopeptide (TPR) repeat protein
MNAATLVLLSLLAQAGAQTTDPESKAKAQVLLKDGAQSYRQGAYAEALEKFDQAYAIFPSPKLLINIGQANRELGRVVEAVDAFEKFLSQSTDASPDLIAEAKRSVNELAPKIGKLLIDCNISGAEITGGRKEGRANTPRGLRSGEPR